MQLNIKQLNITKLNKYKTIKYNELKYKTIKYDVLKYKTIKYNALKYKAQFTEISERKQPPKYDNLELLNNFLFNRKKKKKIKEMP